MVIDESSKRGIASHNAHLKESTCFGTVEAQCPITPSSWKAADEETAVTLEKDPPAPAVELDGIGATGSPLLRVFVSGGADSARVVLAGELDDATAGHLNDRLREVTAELAGDLSVDLGLLTFIDSTGLAVLVTLHKRVQAMGWTLIVVEPTARARRLFQITGLDQFLMIEPAG